MPLKVVISDPKTGFTVQRELSDADAKGFMGLKIGDKAKGELINLQGFEFEVTGGSDFCGFPMRWEVQGTGRRKILSYAGVGFGKIGKGALQRKTVCGNTIHAKTAQVNLKAVSIGSEDIFAGVRKKAEEKKAGRKVEARQGAAEAAEKPDKKEVRAEEKEETEQKANAEEPKKAAKAEIVAQ